MQAEIIAIGTELTSGARLDTNSQWLSTALGDLGIPTLFHTTVADVFEHNVAAVMIAAERTDVIMMTGGLGPTQDDLTRDVLAVVMGVKLELHQPSLEHIRELFESRGRTMPDRNSCQAMFPSGSSPLPNPIGTAPGIWLEIPRADGRPPCLLAAMPGVPDEMRKMFQEEVIPRLPQSGQVIRHRLINCYGQGESKIESLLGDLTARNRDPEVGITAHEATITLRIAAHGNDVLECETKIQQTEIIARERLADLIFGVEYEELEDIVVHTLADNNKTIAFVECGLGGLLSSRLMRASHDAEGVVLGGEVQPTADISREQLAETTAAIKEKYNANYAIGTYFPTEETSGDAYRRVFGLAAIATPDEVLTERITLLGVHRVNVARTAKTALNMLRLKLQG